MKVVPLICACLLISGCSLTDAADRLFGTAIGETMARETYERLEDYCEVMGADLAGRIALVERLNSQAEAGGPRVVAQDCNGDGAPDF